MTVFCLDKNQPEIRLNYSIIPIFISGNYIYIFEEYESHDVDDKESRSYSRYENYCWVTLFDQHSWLFPDKKWLFMHHKKTFILH